MTAIGGVYLAHRESVSLKQRQPVYLEAEEDRDIRRPNHDEILPWIILWRMR
jgi:hypothetical protein